MYASLNSGRVPLFVPRIKYAKGIALKALLEMFIQRETVEGHQRIRCSCSGLLRPCMLVLWLALCLL